MSMPRTALAAAVAALLSVSVAACSRDAADTAAYPALPDAAEAPATDPAVDAGIAQPEPTTDCNADAVQGLVGQEATDAVVEQARIDSGSSTVRALKPGDAATMDFRQDRLNIELDENGIVQSLRCG